MALAQPAARGTSAGEVLQQGTKGVTAASPAGRTIGEDAAAINYPGADHAFAGSDGIPVADAPTRTPDRSGWPKRAIWKRPMAWCG